MIPTLALLCLIATPALGILEPSLKLRFDFSCSGIGTTAFIAIPQNKSAAFDSRWVQKERPKGPAGLQSLELWCPSDDYTICILYDDTDYIAGLQIAFDKERVSNSVFDLKVQGHTNWTTTLNGTEKQYYTTQQYYVSNEILAIDPAIRTATRNSSVFLQHGNVWLSGINGELFNVSSIASYVTGEDSIFTEQICIPRMGYHYYYNMTESTECSAEALFPWFPLIYDDQLIGVGFNLFGTYTVDAGSMNWFEYSGETAVRYTIPNGPDCLYELARDVGQVTLHTYFIDAPYLVTCMA